MIIALDTETTGLDFEHGAKPFMVQVCDEGGNQQWWEWRVDPLTRQPKVSKNDLEEIREYIKKANTIVCQNSKFDVAALDSIGVKNWPWEKTEDTLVAGHLLATNQPHDLTTMALVYLGKNIQPYEDKIQKATNDARRLAKKWYPNWMIAKTGLACMPSAKGKVWKNDMWLPREVALQATPKEADKDWEHLVSDYGVMDSIVTLAIFLEQKKQLEELGLWKIYKERLKLLPIVYGMQKKGITLSSKRLKKMQAIYQKESEKFGRVCISIAKSLGFELSLPKSGNNKSLNNFIFDVLKLEPIKRSKKTGVPSLDKEVMEAYELSLKKKSKAYQFIKQLKGKRKRDTALSYMEGYEKFMLPIRGEWYRLFPSLNFTGTDTLRWSSNNPNEQNISKKEGFNLRYSFGPIEGREWWALDYDNLELRIPAYESNEQEMIRLFEKPKDPPFFGSYHLLVCSILHPEKWERCLKDGIDFKKRYPVLYGRTKNGNFANQYGAVKKADGWGTADKAYGVQYGQTMVQERLSKVALLNEEMIKLANKNGFVETIPDREVDPTKGYPILCGRSHWGGITPTIPLNYHVQSTACWIVMRAMIKVQKYLDGLNKKKEDYFQILNVHDEIVLDFPFRKNKGNLPKVKRVRCIMESIGKCVDVPLTCGVDYHEKNWSESS